MSPLSDATGVDSPSPDQSHVLGLRCRECGREYGLEPLHVCEFCFGPLEVSYDYETMHRNITRETIERGPNSVWRYDRY